MSNVPSPVTPVPAKVAHPWRRTLRTVLAVVLGLCGMLPLVINELNIDPAQQPKLYAFAGVLIAICAAVTRVLAIPAVEQMLQKSLRFLAANDVSASESVPIQSVLALETTKGEVVDTTGNTVEVFPVSGNQPRGW